MELEELKNLLSQAVDRQKTQSPGVALSNRPIQDPFRQIKKRCFWIFLFFVAATVLFFPFLFDKSNALIVVLYLILCVEPLISWIGWLQIKSMEKTGGNIQQHLLIRIKRLQSIFRSYIFLNAFFYLILFSALEYFISHPTVHLYGIEKITLPVRLLFYLFFIVFQLWQKRRSYQKNYGDYLSTLSKLLNQIDEK